MLIAKAFTIAGENWKFKNVCIKKFSLTEPDRRRRQALRRAQREAQGTTGGEDRETDEEDVGIKTMFF